MYKDKSKQFAVLGLGRFGRSVVKTLYAQGYDVLACDIDMEVVNEMSKFSTLVVQADIAEENAIKNLGLNNYDVVIVAVGENLETSVMATLLAKENGAKYVIAKAKSLSERTVLLKVGADRVILPEKEMGERLATNLITTNVIDFITLSDKFGIAEIEPLERWIGQTLVEANIRAEYNINVVAIKRSDVKIIVTPKPREEIMEGDKLIVIGENTSIQRVSEGGGKWK